MTTERFVTLACLGIDGAVLDSICDEFDVSFLREDVEECIELCRNNLYCVGVMLMESIMREIAEKYSESTDDYEYFDFDASSPSYPVMVFDGEKFTTADGLRKLIWKKHPEVA